MNQEPDPPREARPLGKCRVEFAGASMPLEGDVTIFPSGWLCVDVGQEHDYYPPQAIEVVHKL